MVPIRTVHTHTHTVYTNANVRTHTHTLTQEGGAEDEDGADSVQLVYPWLHVLCNLIKGH